MSSPGSLEQTDRTRLRRRRERGRFDREVADAVLDEALVAHVGVVTGRGSVVLPMAHVRVEDCLYLHGAPANHLLRTAVEGADVCVTVTLLDGLVLARSAFHHSMNYRCVVIYGRAERVTDRAEARRASAALVDHMAAGRSREARLPTDAELDATLFLRVPIEEGSVKVRSGGPVDDEADLGVPVWAGEVPVATTFGTPVADASGPSRPLPLHVRRLTEATPGR